MKNKRFQSPIGDCFNLYLDKETTYKLLDYVSVPYRGLF
jgi:hypothetical protein